MCDKTNIYLPTYLIATWKGFNLNNMRKKKKSDRTEPLNPKPWAKRYSWTEIGESVASIFAHVDNNLHICISVRLLLQHVRFQFDKSWTSWGIIFFENHSPVLFLPSQSAEVPRICQHER